MKYKCGKCGQEHDDWPAITFSSPTPYNELTDEEKKLAFLSDDICVIEYPDQTDRFIRCTLSQKVNDHCQPLDYGLWVSLSESSFQDYFDNFENQEHFTEYFGWLSNNIPGYERTLSIPTTVQTKGGNHRPEIFPHQSFDHPFVNDYYNGIAREEAEIRLETIS